MKSAREMFEELGYKEEYHISYIKFIKKLEQHCCDDVKELQIWFYQPDESFEKIGGIITMEELQAINKQVEELHWNDTTVNIDVKLDGKKVMEAMRGENNA